VNQGPDPLLHLHLVLFDADDLVAPGDGLQPLRPDELHTYDNDVSTHHYDQIFSGRVDIRMVSLQCLFEQSG